MSECENYKRLEALNRKAFELAKDGLRGWTEAQRLLEDRDARLETLRKVFGEVAAQLDCPIDQEHFISNLRTHPTVSDLVLVAAFGAAFPELKAQKKDDEKG